MQRGTHLCAECILGSQYGKQYGVTSKFEMELLYGTAVPLLGMSSKESATLIGTNIFTAMFFTGLCKIPRSGSIPCAISKIALVHCDHGILLGCEDKGNLTICDSVDGTEEPYVK